jgi:hypothetical protein
VGFASLVPLGLSLFSYMSWEHKLLNPDLREPNAAEGRTIAHRVKSVTAYVNQRELDSINRTTVIMYSSYVALILMASVEFFMNKNEPAE